MMCDPLNDKDHSKEIGGYFELEVGNKGSSFHPRALALNSARNCFQYIITSKMPDKVYLPVYVCNSLLSSLQRCDIGYEFYHINERFEIENDITLGKNDLLLYVNYFGIKSRYCKELAESYGTKLIIDNSQAFFEEPLARIDTFYSPRKFFGVSDGGYLYTQNNLSQEIPTDNSYERISHLIGRIENSANEHYREFRESENGLYDLPIKKMSKFTSRILQGIDYEKAKLKRERNFLFLHGFLKDSNEIDIDIHSLNGPMVYPYLVNTDGLRNKLINNRIYVAKYWPEIESRSSVNQVEKKFIDKLIPLPIDQRYDLNDMYHIIKSINL